MESLRGLCDASEGVEMGGVSKGYGGRYNRERREWLVEEFAVLCSVAGTYVPAESPALTMRMSMGAVRLSLCVLYLHSV